MKKFKLMDYENHVYTFFISEDDTRYSLYLDGNEEVLIEAKDTENGFIFTTRLPKEIDYDQIDYLHLFLKLVNKFDKKLFSTFRMYEEVAEI